MSASTPWLWQVTDTRSADRIVQTTQSTVSTAVDNASFTTDSGPWTTRSRHSRVRFERGYFGTAVDRELGAFSISLTVKDLAVSRRFHEKLGFSQLGGNPAQNWLILKNGEHVIGLFQGMFEGNMLTFNPDWDQVGNELPEFTDARELQRVNP